MCQPSQFGSSQVDFTFIVNGTTYRGRDSLSAARQAACIHDRKCIVTYLPRDPNVHCLGSADPLLQSHYRAANFITLTLSLAFAFLLLFVEIRARRELRLARDGEVTEGRIIEKTTSKGKNRTIYWVRYRFDTPDQPRRTGWVKIGPLLWECLHYGSLIAILYDPKHPGRHCPSFGLRYVHFLAEAGEEGSLQP